MKDEPRKEGCCELCGEEWQPNHYASPRDCAFKGEKFDGSNWNCGLVAAIRDAMYDADGHTSLRYRNDEVGSYGALVVAVPNPEPESSWASDYALTGLLVGEWYKDRGCTDALEWALRGEDGVLTRDEAKQIVGHLKQLAE